MKNPPNTPLVAAMESISLKQAYKTPVLQRFGLVTDLTNGGFGSCTNDGLGACKPDPNMAMPQ